MKVSVRKKVANGLVLFLVMPKAVATANELYNTYQDGFSQFRADDNFDLASNAASSQSVKVKGTSSLQGDDPSGADPSGYDPSGFDPSGYDPSGGDPSACDIATAPQQLVVEAPRMLVTAEDGTSDLFQVSMPLGEPFPRTFYIHSDKPYEAQVFPDTVVMDENACIPQSIRVIGQNDYFPDGDVPFTVDVTDQQDLVVGAVPGVNLDNDDYRGIAVDVLGPTSLPQGGTGLFLVRVANVSGADVAKNTLLIETTRQLEILNYAAALLSGNRFKIKGKPDGTSVLEFKNVDIATSDMLIVSVDVQLNGMSTTEQEFSARFVSREGEQTDDDIQVRSAVP